jgi:hypothetical protein
VNNSDPTGLATCPKWFKAKYGYCPIPIEGITVEGEGGGGFAPECITSICEPAERDRPWAGGGGGDGRGDGGGGGGGGGPGQQLARAGVVSLDLLQDVAQCALNHYGLGDLAARGASWLGAVPLSKPARGIPVLPGSSQYTNPISLLGRGAFPNARIPWRVLRTRQVFGIIGRANVFTAWAFLAYDGISIAACVAGG